jgi:hypothetical protein
MKTITKYTDVIGGGYKTFRAKYFSNFLKSELINQMECSLVEKNCPTTVEETKYIYCRNMSVLETLTIHKQTEEDVDVLFTTAFKPTILQEIICILKYFNTFKLKS